jgi:DTW domain-containing protein YfiP
MGTSQGCSAHIAGRRERCFVCHYPLSTCICDAIELIESITSISILQDPSESKHAKNTARIAPLMLANSSVYVGVNESDFIEVVERVKCSQKTLLVYPSPNAVKLGNAHNVAGYDHLLFLDGTWRKAKKLWLNNPWLHELDACVIEATHASQYRIRKAPDPQSMSTLEAIAWTLNIIEGCDTAPFFRALEALQGHWVKHQ